MDNRLNLSEWQTKPKFVSLLKEPERFKAKQCRALFGSHFIKEMVREATNDQKLSNIGRPAGQSSSFKSRYPNTSYNSRSSASGNHHTGYNGGNRGGYFSGENKSNGGYRNNKQKSSQRYVPILSASKQAVFFPPVGGVICKWAKFN